MWYKIVLLKMLEEALKGVGKQGTTWGISTHTGLVYSHYMQEISNVFRKGRSNHGSGFSPEFDLSTKIFRIIDFDIFIHTEIMTPSWRFETSGYISAIFLEEFGIFQEFPALYQDYT